MAQKDKIKELVGRGLNSYHTKSLQQIDRIEKKNKEQNHKISILSNELDNDYLTKTEEGSVISLEHSKEGMVYLDELQGNTMVNYCTDGSKELTLNGDIDVEGTFVTTTEGVDNGKVDVMCEGNTLVNCIQPLTLSSDFGSFSGTIEDGYLCFSASGSYKNYFVKKDKFIVKPSTTYTFVVDIKENTLVSETKEHQFVFGDTHAGTPTYWTGMYWISRGTVGRKVFTLTTRDCFDDVELGDRGFITNTCTSGNLKFKYMILEGDWTNKEIPPYLEGMKSVGQDDENGHKIEILSQNKNLYDYNIHTKPFGNYCVSHQIHNNGVKVKANNQDTRGCSFIKLYANEDLYISLDIVGSGGVTKKLADNTYIENYIKSNEKVRFKLEKGRDYKIELNAGASYDAEVIYDNIIISKNNYTDFVPRMLNKKEILINEPLRGLPNGIKDRKIKIGGKWYIERNCKEVILNGSENWIEANQNNWGSSTIYSVYLRDLNNFKAGSYVIGDKFPSLGRVVNTRGITNEYITGFEGNYTFCILGIKMDKLSSNSVSNFKTWLQSNPIKVIYELATPEYEPLEIESTLDTYNDVTHISNNSIIPCNMKIKNTGYIAIIKPSTLYTVALDTNKSGTIGMNLGGAKGTTTNNVLKLTTPATLTDDSLRLYGKGIKGSKVRLLEGDKTNWIPSHFEGMKSSFEDKVQDDGSYKMEILSNKGGMNLCINSDDIRGGVSSGIIIEKVDDKGYKNVTKLSGNLSGNWFNVSNSLTTKISPNTTITISVLARTDKPNNQSKLSFYLGDYQPGDYVAFNEPLSNEYKWVSQTRKFISNSFRPHFGLLNFNGHSVYISKMKIEFGNKMTEWCPSIKDASWSEYKNYNKIQFSSIEPLRKFDRFVFKDGKLMIERGSGTFILNSKNGYSLSIGGWENKTDVCTFEGYQPTPGAILNNLITFCTDSVPSLTFSQQWTESGSKGREGMSTHQQGGFVLSIKRYKLISQDVNGLDKYLRENPIKVTYKLAEPTYEEIPFELQKIILEGYENGTLFFDTNIPPTSTITYAGETPIVKATKLNKTEVLNNTNDINDNIIPYLMDMDYRVVCLQLQSENTNNGVSMARLFGGAYEMLQRDIQSKRYSTEEYRHRLDAYLSANKITEEEYNKLGDMLNE